MKEKTKNALAWLAPGAAVLAADRLAKRFLTGVTKPLIPGVIGLKPARNTGMALGLLQGNTALIIAVSVLLAALCLWIVRGTRIRGLGRCALSMMAGGALGNLWDRIVLGWVQDMFELLFMDFYIFNAADVGVVAGAALCGVSLLLRPRDWSRK